MGFSLKIQTDHASVIFNKLGPLCIFNMPEINSLNNIILLSLLFFDFFFSKPMNSTLQSPGNISGTIVPEQSDRVGMVTASTG